MKKSTLYAILSAVFLALVAVLFFFPDDVQGNALQQADIQQGLANGQEGKVYHEETGETTRWTNSLFSGMPTFQIAPSYASSAMLTWIGKVYMLGLPSPANLLFAMMIGFFIMCLCMKMKWYNALFGALAWGFSTYFIILIGAGHIWKFVTLAYIPPTIGGIVLCYRGKYLGGTALASLFGALQLSSNHPQMSYYFLFVILAMVIAWLVNAIRSHETKRWLIATACIIGAGIISVGANATSLYNSYEYSKETIRGKATELSAPGQAASSGLDKEYITGWSYGIDETLTLLIPDVKGGATIKPVAGNNEILSLADTPKASEMDGQTAMMLSQFPQYFGDQPMTNGPVYVGAFVLLLAVLALFVVDTPMKWALFAVGVLAIFLSWGHNAQWVSDLFIDFVPGYNKFRTVSSILVIVEFTIPLLAVMCIRKILETPDFFRQFRWQFYSVFGAGALICFIGAVAPSVFGSPFSVQEMEMLQQAGAMSDPQYRPLLTAIEETRYSLVSADCWRSLIFILLAAGVMMLYFRKAFNKAVFVLSLAAVMLLDLFAINKRYVNTENFVKDSYVEATPFEPTEADKQILRDTAMNYRVYDVQGFSAARSSYFHKTIGGYHAAKLTRYNDLIEKQIKNNNMAVLNMLNAKYFIVPQQAQPDSTGQAPQQPAGEQVVQNPDALGNAWFVDKVTYVADANAEMKALDNLDTRTQAVADRKFEKVLGTTTPGAPGDTIFETTYAPDRLTYHSRSARPRVAVFSEVYFPWGWTATIDGKEAEIGRVNYVLRSLQIPAGEHAIEFTFRPKSVDRAETLSVVSINIIYVLLAAALCFIAIPTILKHRKGKTENNSTPDPKKEKE